MSHEDLVAIVFFLAWCVVICWLAYHGGRWLRGRPKQLEPILSALAAFLLIQEIVHAFRQVQDGWTLSELGWFAVYGLALAGLLGHACKSWMGRTAADENGTGEPAGP